jgi:parallel beta-helix repeat protein
MPTLTSPPAAPSRTDACETGLGWAPRIVLAVVAGTLVASSLFLPLWRAELVAPQYPQGLHLIAYGDRVAGDVDEVSTLNHYVGMRAFDPDDAPEMALWPFAVAGALAAVAVAALTRRRLPRRLGQLYLWLMPVGVLADIQFRLYQYGHDIADTAAFRIPEFTPLVVGPTKVLNFTTWSWPGTGLLALLAAAAVVTFGPRVARLVARRRRGVTASVLTTALLVGFLAAPAAAHDHTDIASLLDGLAPGGTLRLPAGTYHGNVVIDIPVRIVGVGRPTIVGDGSGSTITIRAPGTVLSGVDVRGSGPGPVDDPAGIRVEADDVAITDVGVTEAYIGIAVSGADRVRLEANTITGRRDAAIGGEVHALGHDQPGADRAAGRGDGIWLWNVDGALIRGNRISNARDGIFVSYGSHALLDGNHVETSRYAVHSMFARDLTLAENTFEQNLSGAVLMYGGPALLLRNTIIDNRSAATGFGVLVKDIATAELVENVVARNKVGLHLETVAGTPVEAGHAGHGGHGEGAAVAVPSTDVIRVHRNTVAANTIGVALAPTTPGRFSANSFVDNTIQVLPKGAGTSQSEWTENGWGNHWSTYRGHAAATPGRGAVAHTEGSAVGSLLTRAPVLEALAGSPAFRMLAAAEQRWGLHQPVVVDDLPLTTSHSPALPAAPADPVATRLLWAVGLLLAAAAGLTLARTRRPRPRRARQAHAAA